MFRLCVAQAPAELDGTKERLLWLRDALPEIAGKQVDLVLLPELFATGYNIGADVALRAEPINGPIFAALSDMAQTFGVAIHCGLVEQEAARLCNAAICVSRDGALLSHQRKLAIPPGFEQTYFTPGKGCQVFELAGVRIATLICYDAEFPEAVRHVAGLGAELVLVPTALGAQWAWVAETMIPTRAFENGALLAYANSAGTERGMAFLGKSVIAAPDGVELARAGALPELLFAKIDPERVRAAQARLPYLQDRHRLNL